jgi:hypothetical protein
MQTTIRDPPAGGGGISNGLRAEDTSWIDPSRAA